MSDENKSITRCYYRSLTPDNEVWCESRNPEEVIEQSIGRACVFEKIKYYEDTNGWETWNPFVED